MNLQTNDIDDNSPNDEVVLDYFQAETLAKEVIKKVSEATTIKHFAKILGIDYQTLLWIRKTDEEDAQQFPDAVYAILKWAYSDVSYQRIHAYQFNPENKSALHESIKQLNEERTKDKKAKWQASVIKLQEEYDSIPDTKENQDQRRILKQRINNTKRNLTKIKY